MFSIKHFLLGAALSLLPVSFYGYIVLRPQAASNALVLGTKTEYHPKTLALSELNIIEASASAGTESPKSGDTAISPEPTKAPDIKPVSVTAVRVSRKVTPPEEVTVLIERYSSQYGINKDMMINIAHCESGFRANATNGPYAGLYQFVSSTWASNRRAMGLDPNPELRFNAEEAVKTAAFKMSRDGYGAWPVCQKKAAALLTSR